MKIIWPPPRLPEERYSLTTPPITGLASKVDELAAYSRWHYCRAATTVLGGRRIAADHAADQPLPSQANARPVGVSLLVGLTLSIPAWKVNANNRPDQRHTPI